MVAFIGNTVQIVFSSSLALMSKVAFIGSTVRTSPPSSVSVTRDWFFLLLENFSVYSDFKTCFLTRAHTSLSYVLFSCGVFLFLYSW